MDNKITAVEHLKACAEAAKNYTTGLVGELAGTITDAMEELVSTKADSSHSHADATQEASGFMSAADKKKLDGMGTGGSSDVTAAGDNTFTGNNTFTLANNNQFMIVKDAGAVGFANASGAGVAMQANEKQAIITFSQPSGQAEGFPGVLTTVGGDLAVYDLGDQEYKPLRVGMGDDPNSAATMQQMQILSALTQTKVPLDGSAPMTGDLQMGGNKVTGLAEPAGNSDAATKAYVDDLVSNQNLGNSFIDIENLSCGQSSYSLDANYLKFNGFQIIGSIRGTIYALDFDSLKFKCDNPIDDAFGSCTIQFNNTEIYPGYWITNGRIGEFSIYCSIFNSGEQLISGLNIYF